MYHQVYGIPRNPFSKYENFYRFCDELVSVKQKKIGGLYIKDYSDGKKVILEKMEPHTIVYTQAAAGFLSVISEEILEVPMKDSTYKLISKLKKDLVIQGKEEMILGDTSVKLMTKMHQLYSGTIKFESGNSMIVDTTKAEFIKEQFHGCKIGIFYKFKEEYNALKQVFGDMLTSDISVFDDTDKNIALQIVSGREGTSLKHAEFLVYYNIDFSATSYWQSRDRMTTKDRTENSVYWIFSKGGIEYDIYDAVTKKKDFTVSHFKKFIKERTNTMKQLNSDFSKAKVGDKVYHVNGSVGTITDIKLDKNSVPIRVNNSLTYFLDGREYLSDVIATIYTHPVKIIHADDMPFEERVMEVSASEKRWVKRVAFMKKNGDILAWNDAETLEDAKKVTTVTSWKFAREVQPVNPRIAEIESEIQELQNELEALKEAGK